MSRRHTFFVSPDGGRTGNETVSSRNFSKIHDFGKILAEFEKFCRKHINIFAAPSAHSLFVFYALHPYANSYCHVQGFTACTASQVIFLSNFERCSGNVSVEVNEMNLDLEFPEASNPWRKVCVLVNGKEVVKPRVQKITRYFLLGKDDFCAK